MPVPPTAASERCCSSGHSDGIPSIRDSGKPLEALSFKHIEVLRLMATGYTNEHIARVKGVALSTVERWTAEIFRDLGIDGKGGVNPRVEAVRQFIAAAGIPEKL